MRKKRKYSNVLFSPHTVLISSGSFIQPNSRESGTPNQNSSLPYFSAHFRTRLFAPIFQSFIFTRWFTVAFAEDAEVRGKYVKLSFSLYHAWLSLGSVAHKRGQWVLPQRGPRHWGPCRGDPSWDARWAPKWDARWAPRWDTRRPKVRRRRVGVRGPYGLHKSQSAVRQFLRLPRFFRRTELLWLEALLTIVSRTFM